MPRSVTTRKANVNVPYGVKGNMSSRNITTSGTTVRLSDDEYAELGSKAIYNASTNPNGSLTDNGPLDSGIGAQGVKASKAAATLPATGSQTLFTITGGRVKILHIQGEVTTVVQAQANATKLQFDPTLSGPATTDLCATADINGAIVGTMYSIVGVAATAMQVSAGIYLLPSQILPAQGLVLPPGTINLVTAATNTGATKWDVWYLALDDGAVVS